MANLLTTTVQSFTANTRAKASEVNAKFSHLWEAFRDGSRAPFTTGYYQKRYDDSAVTLNTATCFMAGYYRVPNGITFDLATSTARAVFFGELELQSTATFHVASAAVALVL